jgi:hypothetical protein
MTRVGVMLERSEASQGGEDSGIFTFLHLGQLVIADLNMVNWKMGKGIFIVGG